MQPHTLLSLVLVAALMQGAAAVCNPAVATETDGICDCYDDTLFYNYKEGSCQEEKDLFLFDGCGPFTTSTGSCECNVGFSLSSSGICEDVDTCSTTYCPNREVCYNNLGPETCKCIDTYRRTISDTCEDLNEELNPQWNDCPQTPYNTQVNYNCYCLRMFTSTDAGRTCTLKPEYSDCSDSEGIICVKEIVNGTEQRFLKQGFNYDTPTTAIDIDECKELPDTNCWKNSHCVNLEAGAGYECVCDPGYTDEIFNGTNIKECVPLKCPKGEGYDCIDPCTDLSCESNEVCVEKTPNIGTCVERLGTAIIARQLPGDLFTVTLETWDAELFASQVTASLKVVFGENAAQASRTTIKQNGFEVEIVSETNATAALLNYCLPLEMMPDYCEMPLGVIVLKSSINPQTKGACDSDTCPETHTCNPVDRRCDCKEGGTGEFINNIYEDCDDSASLLSEIADLQLQLDGILSERDDLQQQLDDAKDSQTVTAAVLGSLLGLAMVGIVVLVFLKKGQFCSS